MLIKCPDCGKMFSEYADCCPICGCPTNAAKASSEQKREEKEVTTKPFTPNNEIVEVDNNPRNKETSPKIVSNNHKMHNTSEVQFLFIVICIALFILLVLFGFIMYNKQSNSSNAIPEKEADTVTITQMPAIYVEEKEDNPSNTPVIGGGENNGNGNNNNNGNDDNGSGNNGNNGNVDWTGNWQNVTDDFSKTISFKKIRVLNKQSNNVNYCCAFFSLNPNDNTTKDTYYNINFYNLTVGDNMSQGPNGIKISSCTPIGDNLYEYEFSNYLYFSHYQENTPRNQLWVLPQTETR